MAEGAVIAATADASAEASAPVAAGPTIPQLAPLVAWAVAALAVAWRRGWLHHPRAVAWKLNLFDDQVLIACGVLLSGLVASLLATLLGARPDRAPTPGISLAALVASCGTTVAAWWMLARARPSPSVIDQVPIRRATLAGLLGLVVAWPIVALVSHLGSAVQQWLGGPPVPEIAHDTLAMLRVHAHEPAAWLLAISVVALAPLAEELLWRGAVQQALKAVGLPRLAAVACSSSLFALVHWNAVPADARLGALPALAALGFAFGWLMERCGRLAAPVAAHAAFNAANLLLFSMLPG